MLICKIIAEDLTPITRAYMRGYLDAIDVLKKANKSIDEINVRTATLGELSDNRIYSYKLEYLPLDTASVLKSIGEYNYVARYLDRVIYCKPECIPIYGEEAYSSSVIAGSYRNNEIYPGERLLFVNTQTNPSPADNALFLVRGAACKELQFLVETNRLPKYYDGYKEYFDRYASVREYEALKVLLEKAAAGKVTLLDSLEYQGLLRRRDTLLEHIMECNEKLGVEAGNINAVLEPLDNKMNVWGWLHNLRSLARSVIPE